MISIIVTTKNEEAVLPRLLKSIKKQTYKNYEIIIVDNNSSDNTKKIAKEFTSKVYNKGPERSVQRNFGFRKSSGKYLLILDADMELSPNILKDCIKAIKKTAKTGAVSIPEVSIATNFWEKVKAYERSFYNQKGDRTTDAERFFSRSAFDQVGGYDENITGPEDWDLPESIKRAGYKSSRIKSVILHHERVPSPYKLAKKKYYYALTSHRYLKKHNIPAISPKTIYFLRPVFYKNWKKLITNPILTVGLFVMFSFELVGGGMGYIIGKIKNL